MSDLFFVFSWGILFKKNVLYLPSYRNILEFLPLTWQNIKKIGRYDFIDFDNPFPESLNK